MTRHDTSRTLEEMGFRMMGRTLSPPSVRSKVSRPGPLLGPQRPNVAQKNTLTDAMAVHNSAAHAERAATQERDESRYAHTPVPSHTFHFHVGWFFLFFFFFFYFLFLSIYSLYLLKIQLLMLF